VAAAELKAAAASLPNLVMVGYQSADRLSEVLASADLHLILLRKGLGASSVPSKMYSILAAGRPIVASIDPDSEVTRVLGEVQAGLSVPPEDPEAFVAAVEQLLDDPQLRQEMGQAGRNWVKQWPTATQIAQKYQELAKGLAKG
jgi:colanic acid biosynthesis glycosyl transferase WcaI